MTSSGWVKNWRSIDGNPVLDDHDIKSIFQELIRLAAWEDCEVWCERSKRFVALKMGQCIVSQRSFVRKNCSYKRVRTIFERLEKGRMIGAQGGAHRSVITICNYAKCQDMDDQKGAHSDADGAQQGRTLRDKEGEEGKEGKKREEKKERESASADPGPLNPISFPKLLKSG